MPNPIHISAHPPQRVGIGLRSPHMAELARSRPAVGFLEVDAENFMSGGEGNLLRPIGIDWPLIPLELNPPHQQRYRKVLEPFFAPANINALDGSVRNVCNELIAGFENRNSCEFIGEFAEKFPSYIFLDLMGMPRERLQDFLDWERGMLRGITTRKISSIGRPGIGSSPPVEITASRWVSDISSTRRLR